MTPTCSRGQKDGGQKDVNCTGDPCSQDSPWNGFSAPGAMVYVTADFTTAYHRALLRRASFALVTLVLWRIGERVVGSRQRWRA